MTRVPSKPRKPREQAAAKTLLPEISAPAPLQSRLKFAKKSGLLRDGRSGTISHGDHQRPRGLKPARALIVSEPTGDSLCYRPGGIHEFVDSVGRATPYELVDIERRGVHGGLVKDLAKTLHLSTTRVFSILGIPKATAAKKAASGAAITGAAGQAALGMVKLLGIAQTIIANSDSADAKEFDTSKWLGQWIERPQPVLGGRKPADLLDTPTGVEVVSRLLGAIESGTYQ